MPLPYCPMLERGAFGGFARSVRCTTSLTFSGVSGLIRGRRSFSSPSTPLAICRRRQRPTVSRLLPTAAAIPSAVKQSLANGARSIPPNYFLPRVPVRDGSPSTGHDTTIAGLLASATAANFGGRRANNAVGQRQSRLSCIADTARA